VPTVAAISAMGTMPMRAPSIAPVYECTTAPSGSCTSKPYSPLSD
jgi:hypothetical protein